jgi:integrase
MPKPQGAFFDKRAGCWASSSIGELRYTKAGKPYRTKVFNRDLTNPTKDRLAAQAWVKAELDAAKNRFRSTSDPNLFQVAEWYLESVQKTTSPETYRRRVEALRRVLGWPGPEHPQRIGLITARQLAKADIRRFVEAMTAEGNSESYVKEGLLKSVKAMVAWAHQIDEGTYPGLPLPVNPLAKMTGPDVPRRAPREISQETLDSFFAWLGARAERQTGLPQRFARISVVMLRFIRETGCRPKEACVATWEEWRMRADGWGVVTLPPWKWKNGKKTKQDRVIAVPPGVAESIEQIRSLPGHHPRSIFTRRRNRGAAEAGHGSPFAGEPFVPVDDSRKTTGDTKSVQKWFFRLCNEAREAGVELPPGFRLYWLRSAYSTEGQRKGASRSLLASAMGTSEKMLDRSYTDFDADDIVNVAKAARGQAGIMPDGPRPDG